MVIFAGNAHRHLAQAIVEHLHQPLGNAHVGSFSDGEVNVEIQENVRGQDVFIVQPTCAPTNDNLMELLLLADTVLRSSAVRITAVVPYFGYSRQDRRPRSMRVPISAKLVANMLTSAGCNRVLTIDLHADQIQGFFDLPLDNIYATPLIVEDIRFKQLTDVMVVSPDVGGVARARALAKRLDDNELAIIDKRRPRANHAEIMNIIGDVQDRNCILVDDIVDTGGTLCQAAAALKEQGAASVRAYCTHAVLSGGAIENISNSVLDELVVTDTIPLSAASRACDRIHQLSVAGLLAETIRRVHNEESISSLFS